MTRKGLWLTGGGVVLLLFAASSSPVAAQDLFVASLSDNSISRITSTGAVSTFATGFSTPFGLAFNSSRELFVANFGTNSISRVSQSGVVSNFNFTGATLNRPEGLVFAPNGDLYVANRGSRTAPDGSIIRITPQGVATTIASGLLSPADLTYNNGNLYATNSSGSGAIGVYEITMGGTVSNYIPNGVTNVPYGLAVSSAGDVYVNSSGNGRVSWRTPTGSYSTFLASGSLSDPMGMAFSGSDLFVAQSVLDGNNNVVGTISRVTPDRTITTYATGISNPSGLAFLFPSVAIPEPGSLTLLGLGALAGAGLLRRRK